MGYNILVVEMIFSIGALMGMRKTFVFQVEVVAKRKVRIGRQVLMESGRLQEESKLEALVAVLRVQE